MKSLELDTIRGRDSRAKNPAATWTVQDRRDLLAHLDSLTERVEDLPTPKRHVNDSNGNWFTTDMEYGWDCAVQAVLKIIRGEE